MQEGELERQLMGQNQAPPQALAARVQVHVNPATVTDGEVRLTLVQMAEAITTPA